MFPSGTHSSGNPKCLPHAGGGVSSNVLSNAKAPLSSPRRWGCFYFAYHRSAVGYVFPTQVGVFLRPALPPRRVECLPHAGGGVSPPCSYAVKTFSSSPRRWGCFSDAASSFASSIVFPTQVGVFLQHPCKRQRIQSLPHAGGVCFLFNRIP